MWWVITLLSYCKIYMKTINLFKLEKKTNTIIAVLIPALAGFDSFLFLKWIKTHKLSFDWITSLISTIMFLDLICNRYSVILWFILLESDRVAPPMFGSLRNTLDESNWLRYSVSSPNSGVLYLNTSWSMGS